MKKIIALVLALTMCLFALTACGGADGDVAAVEDAGKLVVGITDYEPMDYTDASGKWIGFDAELAEQFAATLGVECVFVEIDWKNKVAEIPAELKTISAPVAASGINVELPFDLDDSKVLGFQMTKVK